MPKNELKTFKYFFNNIYGVLNVIVIVTNKSVFYNKNHYWKNILFYLQI